MNRYKYQTSSSIIHTLSRLLWHCVWFAGCEGETDPVCGRPRLHRHPEVQEAAGLEDFPCCAWPYQGASSLDGEEMYAQNTPQGGAKCIRVEFVDVDAYHILY